MGCGHDPNPLCGLTDAEVFVFYVLPWVLLALAAIFGLLALASYWWAKRTEQDEGRLA